MFYEIKTYRNEQGLEVREHRPVESEPATDLGYARRILGGPKYTAIGALNLPNGQQVQFAFDIDGATLEEAFANFQECAKRGSRKTEEEIINRVREAQSRIVMPGQPGAAVAPTRKLAGV